MGDAGLSFKRITLLDLAHDYKGRTYQAAFYFERHIGALVLRR